MEALVIFVMVVVQLVRCEQAEVFVPPCEPTDIGRRCVHLLLKQQIPLVICLGREFFQEGGTGDKLVPVPASNLNCFLNRDNSFVLIAPSHPLSRIPATE